MEFYKENICFSKILMQPLSEIYIESYFLTFFPLKNAYYQFYNFSLFELNA